MARWIVVIGTLLFVQSQVAGSSGDSRPAGGVWEPAGGRSRDEWLRCHGFPCDVWQRTRRKLLEYKLLTSRRDSKIQPLVDDVGDSLDDCIWLTEEQLDEMFRMLEIEAKAELDAANWKGVQLAEVQTKARTRTKRKVTNFRRYPFSKWPTKTIYWKFDGEHNGEERRVIRGAFSHWQRQTCMRFVELGTHEAFASNHILVTKQSTGCHSFIGRITAIPQQLNLQRECLYNLGTPVHEIGHSLGLWHEQQRSDRDSAIRILWQNLGYYVGQFYKQATDNLTPYDYGSVMHYGPMDGSKNGKHSMETLNPLYQHNIGQRTGLSFLDAKAINLAYCQDVCSTPLTGCKHGGYQDPNNCGRCKCPDGLSGILCEKVAPPENAICGGDFNLSSSALYIESPEYMKGPYPNHVTCSWRVKVPEGSQISLRFEGEFAVYSYYQEQCHHWVEVRYKDDIGTQGPRFCGYRRPNDTVTSVRNEMLIVFKSNWTADGVYSRIGFRARLERVGPMISPQAATRTTSYTSAESRTTTAQPPAPTTTTTRSTTTTTTTTERPTIGNDCDVVDLILMMDSSGGVRETNWDKVLHFAIRIVSEFDVSPEGVRVGVITYSSHAELTLPLRGDRTLADVTDVIDGAAFQGGVTNTHVALMTMRAQLATHARPEARRVGVLVTDGQTALPYLAIQQALLALSDGVDLYVAGIDQNFNYNEAASMVKDKKHILQIESFDDLVSPVFDCGLAMKELICGSGVPPTSSQLSWSCDFEDDTDPFCDMIQEADDDQFDWTRHSGRTPSSATGPERAYSGKYYVYIEASDPRKPGDEAVLYLPEFDAQGSHCLSFAYNMYGFHIRTLQVVKKSKLGTLLPIWLRSGEQGQKWLSTKITISLQEGDKIMFIGKRGNAYSGDIAIDYVRIKGGKC